MILSLILEEMTWDSSICVCHIKYYSRKDRRSSIFLSENAACVIFVDGINIPAILRSD